MCIIDLLLRGCSMSFSSFSTPIPVTESTLFLSPAFPTPTNNSPPPNGSPGKETVIVSTSEFYPSIIETIAPLTKKTNVVGSVISTVQSTLTTSNSAGPFTTDTNRGRTSAVLIAVSTGGSVVGLIILGIVIRCFMRRSRSRLKSSVRHEREVLMHSHELVDNSQGLISLTDTHGQGNRRTSVPVLPTMATIVDQEGPTDSNPVKPVALPQLYTMHAEDSGSTSFPLDRPSQALSAPFPNQTTTTHASGDADLLQSVRELTITLSSLMNDPRTRSLIDQYSQPGINSQPIRRIHEDSGFRTSGLFLPSNTEDETRSLPPSYTRD